MIYWDTSAIVPLYVEEAASSFWEEQLIAVDGTPVSTTLAITEFSYALHHKVILKQLTSRGSAASVAKFTKDFETGRWKLCPLGSDVIAASLRVGEQALHVPTPVALRSLDGLHLGAAVTLKCDVVATGDRRLAAAAKVVGLRTVVPPEIQRD